MVDSHCHLYDEKLNEIRKDILSGLEANNLFCITSGDNISTSIECVKLALDNANIFATVGTHPHEAEGLCNTDLDKYRELAKCEKVVAIGEIGLDYHYEFSPREKQKEVLKAQIKLAKELNLPCVFHVREATNDFLDVLEEMKEYISPSLLHSFNGSIDTAKILLKYGFYFSINGIATFSNARNVLEVIDFLPIENILLEKNRYICI